jgi:hypothetical protein
MTCSDIPTSCYCLECFLKGKHQNHFFHPSLFDSGNCDYGDSHFVIPTGFCSDHSGSTLNPQDEQLNEETIQSVIQLSKELFDKLNSENCQIIFSTLSDLVSTGDGMRRYVVLGIFEFIPKLMNDITQLDEFLITKLMNFLGS